MSKEQFPQSSYNHTEEGNLELVFDGPENSREKTSKSSGEIEMEKAMAEEMGIDYEASGEEQQEVEDGKVKTALELAMERPSGVTMAMEQKQKNSSEAEDEAQPAANGSAEQLTIDDIQVDDGESDSASASSADPSAGTSDPPPHPGSKPPPHPGSTPPPHPGSTPPPPPGATPPPPPSATGEDLSDTLRRRRANAMTPAELAEQQRMQGEAGEASLEEKQQALASLTLAPGAIASWRKAFRDTFEEVAHNDETAREFVRRRIEQLGATEIATEDLSEQLKDLVLASDEDFALYKEAYDRSDSASSGDRLDEPDTNEYGLSLRASTYLQTRWRELKERIGIEGREGRVAAGVGAVATVAAGYLALRHGVETGVAEAQADMTQQMADLQAEAGEQVGDLRDVVEEQQDLIQEQQDVIADLQEQLEGADADSPEVGGDSNDFESTTGDISEQLGLPQDYIERTSEGYVVTAMPGGETDSIWRAAEHALTDYTGQQPSTEQVNALQNQLGDHWLDVGDEVSISFEQIQNSL